MEYEMMKKEILNIKNQKINIYEKNNYRVEESKFYGFINNGNNSYINSSYNY